MREEERGARGEGGRTMREGWFFKTVVITATSGQHTTMALRRQAAYGTEYLLEAAPVSRVSGMNTMQRWTCDRADCAWEAGGILMR